MEMGCYGIGVSRIVGAAIEQNHDDRGIIFKGLPLSGFASSPWATTRATQSSGRPDSLYAQLKAGGIDVLLDDLARRQASCSPTWSSSASRIRIVVGERGLAEGRLGTKGRRDGRDADDLPVTSARL